VAAGESGRVALRIASYDDGAPGCTLEVRDHGRGMPPAVLARVGEPFFTTKEPGQGMGLGLFVARALCEQLGGGLEIESTEGRGTTVRMSVPSHALAASSAIGASLKMEPA
jgi:two-component system sensor histidine kinase RegB